MVATHSNRLPISSFCLSVSNVQIPHLLILPHPIIVNIVLFLRLFIGILGHVEGQGHLHPYNIALKYLAMCIPASYVYI